MVFILKAILDRSMKVVGLGLSGWSSFGMEVDGPNMQLEVKNSAHRLDGANQAGGLSHCAKT